MVAAIQISALEADRSGSSLAPNLCRPGRGLIVPPSDRALRNVLPPAGVAALGPRARPDDHDVVVAALAPGADDYTGLLEMRWRKLRRGIP